MRLIALLIIAASSLSYAKEPVKQSNIKITSTQEVNSVEKLKSANYFLNNLKTQFDNLEIIKNKLSSYKSNIIPLNDFIAHANKINGIYSSIQTDLSTKTSLLNILNDQSSNNKIDPVEITKVLTSLLNEKMESIESVHYRVKLPDGSIKEIFGLDLEQLRGLNVFTANEIIEMRKEAQKLLTMRTIDRRTIDTNYNQFTKNQFVMFINSFGSSQKYRTQNEAVFNDALKDLEQLFWTRSYIRSVYGRSLGSFGINFKKKALHWDLFSDKNLSIRSDFVLDVNELRSIQDLCYAAIQSQSNEAMQQLKLWGPVTSFISFTRGVYTFMSGESQLRQANTLVLMFIIADIEEELTLGKKGGLKQLRYNYQNRWYKDLAHKEYYKHLENLYLGDEDEDDYEADITEINSSSLKGVFLSAINALENQEDRTEQGKKILETIDLFTEKSKEKNKRKKRRTFSK